MLRIILLCTLLMSSFGFAQKVKREELSKKEYNFYDYNKSRLESEGYYYVWPDKQKSITGLKHGQWKYYDKKGALVEVRNYYKNDLHGVVTTFYANGKKESEGYFVKGVQDSLYQFWNEMGNLEERGYFNEGEPSGKWEYFYRDGREKLVEFIDKGESRIESFWLPDEKHTQTVVNGTGLMETFYTNANLKSRYHYKNGIKDGPFVEAAVYGYIVVRGNFKENQKDGEWKYFYITGDLEKVVHYENGLLHGDYRYYFDSDTLQVKGQYEFGKKEGEWQWFTNQGVMDMGGSFQNDLQHGDWVYNYPTGELAYNAYYELGKKEGEWKYFYKDGSKFKVGNFKNDLKHGAWKTWYENGKLLMEGEYVEGKEEGIWKNYWDNGALKNEAEFKNGLLDGYWKSFFENGKPLSSGFYDENLKTGEWKTYFDNGRLKDVGNYKVIEKKSGTRVGPFKDKVERVSVKDGEWLSYSQKDYKLSLSGSYKKGEKHGEWIAYYPGGRILLICQPTKTGS